MQQQSVPVMVVFHDVVDLVVALETYRERAQLGDAITIHVGVLAVGLVGDCATAFRHEKRARPVRNNGRGPLGKISAFDEEG
jgi:hypothetical protein